MVGYLARRAGLTVAEYTPLQIKMAITGYGKATKNQMTEMVGKLVKLDKKIKLDDEYDAIGIALTHLACAKYNSIR
jgi:crossover junction endodeoxyribonuclease RuvC